MAGGGHWLLVGSELLPEASMGPWAIHSRSASCSLGRQGKHVGQAGRGLVGFLGGSAEEQSVISSLPRIGYHTAGFAFNSEWPRDLMRTTKSFVIAWRGSLHMELGPTPVSQLRYDKLCMLVINFRLVAPF